MHVDKTSIVTLFEDMYNKRNKKRVAVFKSVYTCTGVSKILSPQQELQANKVVINGAYAFLRSKLYRTCVAHALKAK